MPEITTVPMVSPRAAYRVERQRDRAIAIAQYALGRGDDPVEALIRIAQLDEETP